MNERGRDEPDEGDERLEVGPPKSAAAGVPGVVAGGRIAVAQMGVRRGTRTLLKLNQADGFDCPGCAWPEEAPAGARQSGKPSRSHAEFCENGMKAVAEEATTRRIGREFFAAHPISDLAGRSDHWLGSRGRLTEPMVKRSGADHYEPVSWDDAFGLLADELNAVAHPDRAVFYTSGRTSNEAAFAYQLFVRQFGTNNLPDCSNLCHESSGVALTETLGVGTGSVTLDDVVHTDLVLVVGQNPGTNHPRMLTALERAKDNGAKVIAINPLPEAGLLRFKNPQRPTRVLGRGTALADLFLQIKVNGDLALFQALNRLLLERAEAEGPDGTAIDRAFLAEHCDGFDALAAHLAALDWDDVHRATGLTRDEIDATLAMVLAADRIIVCWAMGLTQHRNSVPTIREIVNFLLLRGNVGRPGAGVCPVRGHSNVQGDRTMGIYEKPKAPFLDALRDEFGFEPPREAGLDVVDAIRAMRDGDVDVFFGLGGNFVAAAPDTDVTAAAMARCRLTAHVSTKLNRSHTVCGETALILPCLGRTERDVQAEGEQYVTVEDSMGMVHASRGRLEPASPHLRSEVAIVAGLAAATLGERSDVDWAALTADYDAIRDHIEAVVPGFEGFNARSATLEGFALPHPVRDSRTFPTTTGKGRLTVNPLEVLEVPDGHLVLQTIRSHDQFNTTIYGLDDRYRGIHQGRRVVFAHADDLAALGLADGQVVDLVGVPDRPTDPPRRAEAFRIVAYSVARGTCAAYFPETNVLVPLDSTAEASNTPTSKSVIVRLEPRPDPPPSGDSV